MFIIKSKTEIWLSAYVTKCGKSFPTSSVYIPVTDMKFIWKEVKDLIRMATNIKKDIEIAGSLRASKDEGVAVHF